MKVIYHIDVKDKLSSLIWDLLCTNFNCKVEKACHSENGKELNIHITISDKCNFTE